MGESMETNDTAAWVRVLVQAGRFDGAAEWAHMLAQATQAHPELDGTIGATVTFTGLVRSDVRQDKAEEKVGGLFLEHYPGMTERVLGELAETAAGRWPLAASLIIHRHGPMLVGEEIVFVGTASPHRAAAFEAAEFLMDILKTSAPFWKKELADAAGSAPHGGAWVGERDSDVARAQGWSAEEK